MPKNRKPKKETAWASWHPNVGYWSTYPTRSDARLSFDTPSGYDNWQMAKRDGWQIFKCRLTPLMRP